MLAIPPRSSSPSWHRNELSLRAKARRNLRAAKSGAQVSAHNFSAAVQLLAAHHASSVVMAWVPCPGNGGGGPCRTPGGGVTKNHPEWETYQNCGVTMPWPTVKSKVAPCTPSAKHLNWKAFLTLLKQICARTPDRRIYKGFTAQVFRVHMCFPLGLCLPPLGRLHP